MTVEPPSLLGASKATLAGRSAGVAMTPAGAVGTAAPLNVMVTVRCTVAGDQTGELDAAGARRTAMAAEPR